MQDWPDRPSGRPKHLEGTDMSALKENLYLLRDLALPRKTGRLSREDLQAVKAIADWTRDFVAQPHPHLGRGGTVCPFVPAAIEDDTLWFAVEHIKHLSEGQAADLMNQYKDLFLSLDPRREEEPERAGKKTLLVIFPDLPEDKLGDHLEGIQRPLRDEFVRQGLMLGEFHQLSQGKALHNKDFRPFRSPIPMLTIRHMISTDWLFLSGNAEWTQAWFARFHDGENREEFLGHVSALADAVRNMRLEAPRK
jgi:hypothetical protein